MRQRKSIRLKNYDYASPGSYFVTICTGNRIHFFGDINAGRMDLSDAGRIVMECWKGITVHFQFVELGEYIIMPDHIHGIINILCTCTDAINRVSTGAINRAPIGGGITGSKNPMLHQNLSTIVRWFKGRSTYEVRKIMSEFCWQSRFYEHVIRNDESYRRISEYIKNNPSMG